MTVRKPEDLSLVREELRKFDDISHAVTFIDEEHRLTHDGAVYSISSLVEDLPATGGTFYLLVRQPAVKASAHIRRWRITPDGGPVLIKAFEEPVVSSLGTRIFGRNQNRNWPDDHNLEVYSAPVVVGEGITLLTQFVPGETSDTFQEDAFGQEWVLRYSETDIATYLLKIENKSNKKVSFGLHMFWYEPPYGKQESHLDD